MIKLISFLFTFLNILVLCQSKGMIQNTNISEEESIQKAEEKLKQDARDYVISQPHIQSAEEYAEKTLGNEEEYISQELGKVTSGSATSENIQTDKNNQGVDRKEQYYLENYFSNPLTWVVILLFTVLLIFSMKKKNKHNF